MSTRTKQAQVLVAPAEVLKNKEEFEQEVKTSLESFNKEDRGFDCKRCGIHYTPLNGQWIFYELCNRCFSRFDTQKMKGRFSLGTAKYFESVKEWISSETQEQNGKQN